MIETIINHVKFKIATLTCLFAFACAEKTTVVVADAPPPSRPPGLIVASDKALENGKKASLVYSPDRGWQARVNATIGLTLLYMGRDDDAVVYFERARVIDPRNEIIVAYYNWDAPGKGPKKPKIKKKPKDREGFEITLRWLD